MTSKFKKILAVIVTICLMITVCPLGLFSFTASADSNSYIKIYTVADLYCIRYDLTANYILMNDIDLTEATAEGGEWDFEGKGWDPIGSNSIYGATPFTGVFDGNRKTISGIRIDVTTVPSGTEATVYAGLFSQVNGTVKNLTVTGDMSFENAQKNIYIGGIAGTLDNATIENCRTEVNIYAKAGENVRKKPKKIYVGGISGFSKNGTLFRCSSIGNIEGVISGDDSQGYVGGIIGDTEDSNTQITESYNEGDVTITAGPGDYYGGNYHNCRGRANGISNNGNIHYGYNTGVITGIVIPPYKGCSECYTSLTACGISYNGYISNCYNAGDIFTSQEEYFREGSYSAGISYRGTKIENCYNVGNVSNNAGKAVSYTDATNCYYLSGVGESSTGASALTSAQMKIARIYEDFSFDDVWTMGGDEEYLYPELQCFTLRGEISIRGDIVYDSDVSPDTSEVENSNNTLQYKWYVDDVEVGSEKRYTIKAEDVGKRLKLKVISTYPLSVGVLYSKSVSIGKATQEETPITPEIVNINDNSIEITTIPTQEYSIDNINWQSAGVFDNLAPNKTYTVYSRILENDLYLLGESAKVLEVTTDRRAISGNVNITGTPCYGNTLTANITNVVPSDATLNFEWMRNGQSICSGNTYAVTTADIGNNITVSVNGTGNFCGNLISGVVVPTKAIVQAPMPPTVLDKTNTSVTLISNAGYEYSKDKLAWQDSSVFTGLSAATEYTFYQRIKETDTALVSEASSGTRCTTLKNTVYAPSAPTVEAITNTSVALTKVVGYEYSKDGLTWQTNNVFTGLKPNTSYLFRQRIAETNIEYASPQSEFTLVTTLKNSVSAPNVPIVISATDTSVTLTAIDGYEYSIDKVHWQRSNVFSNLTALNTYTFYQRIAETDTDFASSPSDAVSFKVKNVIGKTQTPVLREKSNNRITVEAREGCIYSIDGINWNSNNIFVGLSPNTTYSIYCKYLENDTHYAGDISEALLVTTLKNTVNKPQAPTISNKSNSSVTLNFIPGYEFSKDGITWQTSNIFTELSPNTTYVFYQRIAETNTDYASENSECLTVTTLKNVVNPPSAPSVENKTSTTVTLVATDGYEYSRDGVNWQKSNVFIGLTDNKEYTFYQRIAETNFQYASEKSDGLLVKLYIIGDIDGVDGITDRDAEWLLMYTFFPEDYPVNQGCDFNGDGKVNDADAEHLLMFTFFPEDYPLH